MNVKFHPEACYKPLNKRVYNGKADKLTMMAALKYIYVMI